MTIVNLAWQGGTAERRTLDGDVAGPAATLASRIANAGFLDADDLLLDITGATGTISTGNFI